MESTHENGVAQTLRRQCDMRRGVNVLIRDDAIARMSGYKPHLESRGRICAKASAAVDLVHHPDRFVRPLNKNPDGSFGPISYERAMDEIAGTMERIREADGARAADGVDRRGHRVSTAGGLRAPVPPRVRVAQLFLRGIPVRRRGSARGRCLAPTPSHPRAFALRGPATGSSPPHRAGSAPRPSMNSGNSATP